MHLKGTLPVLILKTLERGPSHGYRIASDIKEKSRKVLEFKEGTLYPALHGLENKGLIESYEQEERGRMRRYYRLTTKGRRELDKELAEWDRVSDAISLILKEA